MPFTAATRGASERDWTTDFGGTNFKPMSAWEKVSAGAVDAWQTTRPLAREEEFRDALWARHRWIEQQTGRKLNPSYEMVEGRDMTLPGFRQLETFMDDTVGRPMLARAGILDEAGYEAQIDALRKERPGVLDAAPTREALKTDMGAWLKRLRDRSNRAGALGVVGGLGATVADPGNLSVAVLTGGLGAGRPIVSRMLVQGLAGAATEALQTPGKLDDAREFGGPAYTGGDGARDVLFAGVGGAAFEGLGAAGARALKAWRGDPDLGRGLGEAIDQVVRDEGAVGRSRAGDEFEAGLDSLQRAAPPPAIAPARDLADLFTDGVEKPAQDLEQVFVRPGDGLTGEADYRGRRIFSGRFDPRELAVDAERFQYKADGDAEGVTARLRGVEAWDDTASGKAIVWEDAAGTRFVADGHQRRGLAMRMLDQGWEGTRLDGYLFREADGWTARQVRTVAALKNIREGSGTILDAAKVLRDAPEAAADKSLPVTGEFMGQARALSRLSPEAFGAVVNKVIPERYGAEIGAMAAERQDLHEAMVRLLKQGDPANADEARAMVVEALQDDWIREQGDQVDLFGYDPSVSAMAARAKVAASVKRALARDTKLFGNLIKHADAIEAGGNALARDANEARLAIDRSALELTAKLALRSGPIGEAMAEAAARVVKGEAAGDAAKGVVQRLRAALKAGERLDDLRGVTIASEPPSPAARDLAAEFDDPTGAAAKGQVKAKPEDAAIETPADRGAANQVVDAGGILHPIKGEALPQKGLVVANMKEDGVVYVGAPRELHFQVMERFPDEDGNEILETGFVSPDGKFLNRKEAADWVREHEHAIKPSENMDGGLDAMDYREQVPASSQHAPPAPSQPLAPAPAAGEGDAPGLFDDIMPEVGQEARARQHLTACAPGI